jgi:chemotaxis protein CheD
MGKDTIVVGMTEIKVAKGAATFTCPGLGSCVAVAAYDPVADVAGVAHIMLPTSFKDRPVKRPGKFADTGIAALMAEIEKAGGDTRRLMVAFAGGAQVLRPLLTTDAGFDIGPRNGQAVARALAHMRAVVVASDTGGNQGRTFSFCSESGMIRVRTVTTGERPLCNLRSAAQTKEAA